ncbi:hypothetical protein V7183_24115 [Bacillus sp. JJ1127]|uniref:hypothetical protein n=1 Tax=Bacillus sp. JJ1127 TaxID=3122952 RepID=UPI002FFF926D
MIRKILVGSALAAASVSILSVAQNTLRPIMKAGIRGVKSATETLKEEIEDIIYEAKAERALQKTLKNHERNIEEEVQDAKEMSHSQKEKY